MKKWQKYLNFEASQQSHFLIWLAVIIFGGQLIFAFLSAWLINQTSMYMPDYTVTAFSFLFPRDTTSIWLGALLIIYGICVRTWLKEWSHDGAHLKRILMLPGQVSQIAWAKFGLMLLMTLSFLFVQLIFLWILNVWGMRLVPNVKFVSMTFYNLLVNFQSSILPIIPSHPLAYLTSILNISAVLLMGLTTGILLGGPLLHYKRKLLALIYMVISLFCWVMIYAYLFDTPLSLGEFQWIGFILYTILCLLHGFIYHYISNKWLII